MELREEIQRCPCSVTTFSNIDVWFLKSSCWDNSRAIQQSVFSTGQTGEHFAFILPSEKPRSSRTIFNPFGSPDGNVMGCGNPLFEASGFDWEMAVSCCFRCFLRYSYSYQMPSMHQAVKRHELTNYQIWIMLGNQDVLLQRCWWPLLSVWSIAHSPTKDHQQHRDKWSFGIRVTFPSLFLMMIRPSSSFMKSETWINRPQPFLRRSC